MKKKILNRIKQKISFLLPYSNKWRKYQNTGVGITRYFEFLKFQLFGDKVYWYYHKQCIIANPRKIFVGKNCIVGRPGCYIQGEGTVYIGNYVQFGPNVGILSSNHDLYDQRKSNTAPIKLGDYSWVGMNCVITAGVELGPRTIVAAGSVVTKSFPDGFCVIGGVPAKVIKLLDKEQFIPWHEKEEWYGYLTPEEFLKQRKNFIDI